MAKKTTRPANTRSLKKYKDNKHFEKNKIRKMEQHLAAHPNDEQTSKVLDSVKKDGAPWKRKKPTKSLTHKEKRYQYLTALANKQINWSKVGLPEWKQILSTVKGRPSVRFLRNARKRTTKAAP